MWSAWKSWPILLSRGETLLGEPCSRPGCYHTVQIGTGSDSVNRTQDDYCSLYCRLYTERKLSPVIKTDTLGRRFKALPDIEVKCDTCGVSVHLSWTKVNQRNRSFCGRECYRAIRRVQKKAEIRYNLLRLMRDNPRKTWTVADLADWLDKSMQRNPVSSQSVVMHLRMMSSAVLRREDGRYELRPEAREQPLVKFLPRRLGQ